MAPKCLAIEDIRKKIVRMRNDGATDADSEELRALRRELKSIMLDANAPPPPQLNVPKVNAPPRESDSIETDFLFGKT